MRNGLLGYFAVVADTILKKKKDSENIHKYLDLARELKNMWNITVTVIPIVHGTVPKVFEKELETRGGIDSIHTIALLRLVRIVGKVLET